MTIYRPRRPFRAPRPRRGNPMGEVRKHAYTPAPRSAGWRRGRPCCCASSCPGCAIAATPLPEARPESQGISSARLQRLHDYMRDRHRRRRLPRRRHPAGAQRPHRGLAGLRPSRSRPPRADPQGRDLPHLLDDQDGDLGRGDDAGGGGQAHPGRSAVALPARLRHATGAGRRQPSTRRSCDPPTSRSPCTPCSPTRRAIRPAARATSWRCG